jgi:hypothetical protein
VVVWLLAAVLSHAVWTVQQGPGAQRGRSRGLRDGDVACCVMGGCDCGCSGESRPLKARPLARPTRGLSLAPPQQQQSRRRRRRAAAAPRAAAAAAWLEPYSY